MDESLKILILQCQKNDRTAQAKIYQQFSAKLFSICLRYSNSYEDAQDVFQEGFIHIFNKINQFQFKGSFEGWMTRIMVNFCIEIHRKKNYLYVVNDEITADEDALNEFFFEDEQEAENLSYEELLEFIRQLPDRYQQVFNLYAIEGYTHQQIAELLRISIGTSKSNFFRAREKLMESIKKNISHKVVSK